MIRSAKASTKFSNLHKREEIVAFIEEYKNVMSCCIDMIWKARKIPRLLTRKHTSKIKTWLSQRAIQCAAKQASAIVRGTKQKQKQRLYRIKKLKEEGHLKSARKLQRIYDKNKVSKPCLDRVNPEFDSRFVKIDLNNSTSFDGWVTLTSLGNKLKIVVPFKKHKNFIKLESRGKLKPGIRLSDRNLTFMFELPDVPLRTTGKVLGIDIGSKSTLSCSDDQQITKDHHGWTYQDIALKMARRKKGGNGFRRAQAHRTNFTNWAINRLDFNNVKQVNLEDIKYLKKGRHVAGQIRHWSYPEIFDRLEAKLGEQGVLVRKFNPAYTSQRCSGCGWVRQGNRRRKLFICDKCGLKLDADLNASRNLSLELLPLTEKQRSTAAFKQGFYWRVVDTGAYSPCDPKNLQSNKRLYF